MRNRLIIRLFMLATCITPTLAFAQDEGGSSSAHKMFYLGVGAIARNAGKTATVASSGKKPLFSELYTNLNLSMVFAITDSFSLSPNFFFGFPSKKTPEKQSKTSVYGYGLRVMYALSSSFDFHMGPTVLAYRISGSGDLVETNNGASTAIFGIPDRSSTSSLVSLDTGLGFNFAEMVRLELSAIVSGLGSSAKRAIHPALTLSVGL